MTEDEKLTQLYRNSEARAVPIAANASVMDGISQMLSGERKAGLARMQRAREWSISSNKGGNRSDK